MKKLIHLFLICIMLVTFSSCTNSENKDVAIKDKPAPDFTPLTEVVEGRKDIYLITKELDSNYWDIIEEGAKDAGEELGCNVYHSGTYNEMQWKRQEELLDKCLELKADAVLISPDDSVGLAPKIEELYKKNISVILVDTAANTNSFDVCYMTDNLEAGNKAAEEMIASIEDKGVSKDEKIEVGVMVGNDKSQTINERLAGFFQYWTDNAPDNWKIISNVMNCNGDVETGEKLVNGLLNKYPDLKGFYTTNNVPTRALSKVVYKRKKKDMVVVGFDYSDEIKNLIEAEDYKASTILQRQYFMSYNGVKAALDIINGKSIDVKFEDTGVITVNRENLDDSKVQAVIEGRK